MVISGGVCCSVVFGTLVGVFGTLVGVFGTLVGVFGTLVGVFVFTVVRVAISCPLWSSVYECQRVECAFTSPVRTECGMFVMCCM